MGYRRSGWENELTGSAGLLVIIALILTAAITWTVIRATCTELARLAKRSPLWSPKTVQIIRWCLVGIIGLVVLSVLIGLAVPAAMGAAVYTAAWGFLGMVGVVEGCDWYERRNERRMQPALGELDTYLDFGTPLEKQGGQQSPNGKTEQTFVGA